MLPRRIDLKVGSSSLLRADFCGAPRAAEMRDRSRGWEFEPAKYLFFFLPNFYGAPQAAIQGPKL